MSLPRLIAIVFILGCSAVAWFILGASLTIRTDETRCHLAASIDNVWAQSMTQQHPLIYYAAPGAPAGRRQIQPADTRVDINLSYEPKQRGLFRYRTYLADFHARYTIENPAPIAQTIYIRFQFPNEHVSFENFSLTLDGKRSVKEATPAEGILEAITLAPGQRVPLEVAYRTRGLDSWRYAFGDTTRIRNFECAMTINFSEIDFPPGTTSPDAANRHRTENGWQFTWHYPDVIGARPLGMEMPNILNPGPVAARIAYFSPVSLLFFFTVLLIAAMVRRVALHPMHYFFLAAGYFAFALLFAYLVDILPTHAAFLISSTSSLLLVSGYLSLATNRRFALLAALAQTAYMILFSYSFFFDGYSGLTIAIGAIITLAVLMIATAKVNWTEKFTPAPKPITQPPPIPRQ